MKVSDILRRMAVARDAPVGLDPKWAMHFYCDESSQNAHRYLVLGVLAIFKSDVAKIETALADIRRKYNHHREMAWTCVNGYKFGAYEEWLAVFSSVARSRRLRMTALVLDTHTPANRGWEADDFDLGFNKLIYHLLLHRVGKRYAKKPGALYGELDSRTTRHKPDDLCRMLNGGLRNLGCPANPFREIIFRDSKQSDLIQLVDILVGGLAYERNGHMAKADARPQKIELSGRISTLAVKGRIDVWEWEYKHKQHSSQGA
jgi:hypothetical protein